MQNQSRILGFIRHIWNFGKFVIVLVGQFESVKYYRQSSYYFMIGRAEWRKGQMCVSIFTGDMSLRSCVMATNGRCLATVRESVGCSTM